MDALHQVVDLLESLATRNRQLPRPPQHLERRLLRLPAPPAAGLPLSIPVELARKHRPVVADSLTHALKDLQVTGTEPLPQPRRVVNPRAKALEAMAPVRKKGDGDGRRIVRPVLEQRPPLLDQPREQRRSISVPARRECEMVRPLDDIDRIDLHEPHPLDERQHAGVRRRTRRVVEQALRVEQQPPRLRRTHDRDSRGHDEEHSTLPPDRAAARSRPAGTPRPQARRRAD